MNPDNGYWKLDTKAEQETLRRLQDYILDSAVLLKHCPLDQWRDTEIAPKHDLGDLNRLAVELQHIVLGELDVKSLLAFRAVSKKAVVIVNGMWQWQKAIKLAPDAIRMAIGIRTAHTFTLKELYGKLCQQNCDLCRKPAPYLDVFSLQRRCLDVGGVCQDNGYHTFHRREIQVLYEVSDADLNKIPTFHAIPGCYSSDGRDWYFALQLTKRHEYYDPGILEHFTNKAPRKVDLLRSDLEELPSIFVYNDMKLASVFAPWLSPSSMTATSGIYCFLCRRDYEPKRGGLHGDADYLPHGRMKATFCSTLDELVIHTARKHYHSYDPNDDHEHEDF